MKKLKNVALLATSHNVTKAYIHRLYKLGWEPSKIIFLEWRNSSYSDEIEGLSENDFMKLNTSINSTLKRNNVLTGDLTSPVSEILRTVGWEYQTLLIDHINDENLRVFLNELREEYIIYCGGGILRKEILNSGKRFIHIHPGEVPHVKGADGLLWSSLVYDRIGMSAFFMNEGIDTGDIIDTKSYSIPNFGDTFKQHAPRVVKNLLINFVDPHFRAELLGSLFNNIPDPAYWRTTKQFPAEGRTYYFMHRKLLPQAIRKFSQSKLKMVG